MKSLLNHYPQFVKISEVGKERIWMVVRSTGEHEYKSDAAHKNHWVGCNRLYSVWDAHQFLLTSVNSRISIEKISP